MAHWPAEQTPPTRTQRGWQRSTRGPGCASWRCDHASQGPTTICSGRPPRPQGALRGSTGARVRREPPGHFARLRGTAGIVPIAVATALTRRSRQASSVQVQPWRPSALARRTTASGEARQVFWRVVAKLTAAGAGSQIAPGPVVRKPRGRAVDVERYRARVPLELPVPVDHGTGDAELPASAFSSS